MSRGSKSSVVKTYLLSVNLKRTTVRVRVRVGVRDRRAKVRTRVRVKGLG